MPNCNQEAAHRAASDAELIAWVDEADQLLGSLPRAELRGPRSGWAWHLYPAVLIPLVSCACISAPSARRCIPVIGMWPPAAWCWRRRATPSRLRGSWRKSWGIADVVLREHGSFFFEQPDNRLWCGVFSAVSDAPLQLQAEEVLQARFLSIEAALADAAVQPYCPDSLVALKRYLALSNQAR